MLSVADYYYIISLVLPTYKQKLWPGSTALTTQICAPHHGTSLFMMTRTKRLRFRLPMTAAPTLPGFLICNVRVFSLFSFPRISQLLSVGEEPWEDSDYKAVLQDPDAVTSLACEKMAALCFLICPFFSSLWATLLCYLGGKIEDDFQHQKVIDAAFCSMFNATQCVLHSVCQLTEGNTCAASKQELHFSFDMLMIQNIPDTSNLHYGVQGLGNLHALLCCVVILKMTCSANDYYRKVLKQDLERTHSSI